MSGVLVACVSDLAIVYYGTVDEFLNRVRLDPDRDVGTFGRGKPPGWVLKALRV